jgi:DNA polymerase III epsilon subunit-like protein
MKACVIDCETTGLVFNHTVDLYQQPSVIEFYGANATIIKSGYKITSALNLLIKPPQLLANRPVDRNKKKTIEMITGINDEMLHDKPLFAAVADDILKMIEKAPLVIAHNAAFDKEILDLEFERLGRTIKWPPIICTIEQTMHACGHKLSMAKLYEYLLNDTFQGAHRAEVDVAALLRCLVEMVKRGWL